MAKKQTWNEALREIQSWEKPDMIRPKTAATYVGIDLGTPNGDCSALTFGVGNKVLTFTGAEATTIWNALREARIEGARLGIEAAEKVASSLWKSTTANGQPQQKCVKYRDSVQDAIRDLSPISVTQEK